MSNKARAFNSFTEIDILPDNSTFLVGSYVSGTLVFQQFTKAGFIAQFISPSNELSELTDVTILNVTDKQILQYDAGASKWVNSDFTLVGLQDVTITTPTNGQGLFYNSTTGDWENKGVRKLLAEKGINIFPHRGVVSYNIPENSLLSIYYAGLLGAKIVELDVKITSDGVLVLLHDASLNSQFTNSDGSPIVGTVNIADITYTQALNYIRSSTIDGYKTTITTLDEALKECAKHNLVPLLELPSGYSSSNDTAFLNATRKYFNDEDIMLQSFDDDVLIRFCGKSNYYPVFLSADVDLASEYRGSIFVAYQSIDSTLVNEAIAANVPIFAYTVNSESELNRLLDLGVVNITSDNFSPVNYDGLTYVDNYDSGLSFTNSTIVSGSISSGESLVTLNNAGTLQTPNITTTLYGITNAEVIVEGTCTIGLYYAGILYDTITNTSTTAKSYIISRCINLSNTFYIKVTSTQSNCKVISIKANSYTLPNAVQNRTFSKPVRSDNGIGVGMDADSGKVFSSNGATTPTTSIWDSTNPSRFIGYGDNGNVESLNCLAMDSASVRGTFVGKRSRGTLSTPTTVINGDSVVALFASAYDGGAFRANAGIEAVVDGIVSSGTVPTAWTFGTGTTSRTEKARLTSNGAFLIGRSSVLGVQNELFEVNGSARINSILTLGEFTVSTYPLNCKLAIGGGANGSSASVIQNRMDISFGSTGNSTAFLGIINPDYATMIGVLGTRDGGSNKATIYMRNQQVGIGISVPATSAILDVSSTTKGVLLPRMTTTEKNAISSPATGLIVYDTTLNKLCVYTGAAWQTVTSA